MAATGATPISLYYSSTAGNTPTAGNLVAGELAINTADGKLFYKDSAGVVQTIASKATGVVAGSTTQVIYNNAGAYAGSANMTFDGTKLTVGGLKDSALTSGRVTYATTSGELTDSANFTFNGTTVTIANDAYISTVRVGLGAGAVSNNTVLGLSALAGSNSGTGRNTAVGYSALQFNTTGYVNTAVGSYALQSVTTGYENTAVGDYALRLTTGNSNTGIGQTALSNNTSGSSNTAVGVNSLVNNTTASNNTAVGYQAGYSNTTGVNNSYIGNKAGYLSTGNYNTYVGGRNAQTATSTGDGNIAMGDAALLSLTSGSSNVALGQGSMVSNTTGGTNVAVGRDSLASNTTASGSTAVGYQAGYSGTTATYNALFGTSAGLNLSTGSYNTFIGGHNGTGGVGSLITTGSKNSILGGYNGNQGGLDIRTASNYIVLSDGDGNPQVATYNGGSVSLAGATPKAGTGITFPATQSASSDANTLDDYEEGTWTPVVALSSSNPTVTYVTQFGSYTKVGRQVTITCNLVWSAATGGSGDFRITGLPFSSGNVTNQEFNSGVGISYNVVTTTNPSIRLPSNTAVLWPITNYGNDGIGSSAITGGSFNKAYTFTLTYFTS